MSKLKINKETLTTLGGEIPVFGGDRLDTKAVCLKKSIVFDCPAPTDLLCDEREKGI